MTSQRSLSARAKTRKSSNSSATASGPSSVPAGFEVGRLLSAWSGGWRSTSLGERLEFSRGAHEAAARISDSRRGLWFPAAGLVTRCLSAAVTRMAYRAMAWLGEEIAPAAAGALAPRCVKDLLEERLFERRRDLFSDLSLVFMDTTSLSFYGAGALPRLKCSRKLRCCLI